ncbi:MAG: signal peptidase I [Oligoflexia bacterium]|nr:signal peptidase I [Oligoflexia bacterium]
MEVSETEEVVTEKFSIKKLLLKKIVVIPLSIIFFVSIMTSSFLAPFRIPSGSMMPTLLIGDFILVDKTAYGIKLPYTDTTVGDFEIKRVSLTKRTRPERGDIVVFKWPESPKIFYIKRVIGLPGDIIKIEKKRIILNGKPLEITEMDDSEISPYLVKENKNYSMKYFKSTLGKRDYYYQIDQDNYFKQNFGQVLVPKNSLFVLGDNRDFSFDSRFWGFVPIDNVVGKATNVWFSLSIPGWNSRNEPYKEVSEVIFRPGRIGSSVH